MGVAALGDGGGSLLWRSLVSAGGARRRRKESAHVSAMAACGRGARTAAVGSSVVAALRPFQHRRELGGRPEAAARAHREAVRGSQEKRGERGEGQMARENVSGRRPLTRLGPVREFFRASPARLSCEA
jgi:hypothetical protein